MSAQPRSPCLDENTALELLDGKLGSQARSRIEKHLESCDACRELVAEIAKLNAEVMAEEVASADTERVPFAQATELATGARVGPYRIDRTIGSGAFGTVYRATDVETSGVVALKMVTDPAFCARFKREASTLARLDHPAIVRYIGHGSAPSAGGMYLAMEWLEGEDLEQRLRRGPLGWEAARKLGLRLSGALEHAHALGCIHRDISPRNVFLPGGEVDDAKLLDFGLVRASGLPLDKSGVSVTLERTGSQALLGTPFYMSPEQVRDPKSVDARSDLFGLGVLLYEAISGVRPFQGEDLFSVWVKIVDAPPPDLRALAPAPEAFARLIESMLEKDPAARPRSARDVEQALSLIASSAESSKGGTAALPPIRPRTSNAGTTSPQAWSYPSSAPPHPSSAPPTSPIAFAGTVAMQSAPPPMQHVTARSGPVDLPFPPPPAAPSGPPPSNRRMIIAGVGVTAAIVTATTIGVYAGRQSSDANVSAASPSSIATEKKTKARAAATDVNGHPLVDDDEDEGAASSDPPKTDAPPSAKPAKLAGQPTPAGRYFCGSDTVDIRRHEHFSARREFAMEDAVTVGGDCKLTLEDCVIDGPNSVLVLGTSPSLTLRRCRVLGRVQLVGEVTLILEGTTLPHPPVTTGKPRIIRR